MIELQERCSEAVGDRDAKYEMAQYAVRYCGVHAEKAGLFNEVLCQYLTSLHMYELYLRLCPDDIGKLAYLLRKSATKPTQDVKRSQNRFSALAMVSMGFTCTRPLPQTKRAEMCVPVCTANATRFRAVCSCYAGDEAVAAAGSTRFEVDLYEQAQSAICNAARAQGPQHLVSPRSRFPGTASAW